MLLQFRSRKAKSRLSEGANRELKSDDTRVLNCLKDKESQNGASDEVFA